MANWNSICTDSIRKEKAEIEKRYGIRIGQTEIYCAQCNHPIANPLNHACQDIQLREWQEAKKKVKKVLRRAKETPKSEIPLFQDDLKEINAPSACREALQDFKGGIWGVL